MNLELDVLIFGGGCAGLWLLDELRRHHIRAVLLESGHLGGSQTTASQGILHGGVKYALKGVFTASANAVKETPGRWRQALSGVSGPDLTSVRIRSQSCYLWRSDSWQSWAGMIGARTLLEVKPVVIPTDERPTVLKRCPGQVFRLDEEVIDTVSFVEVLAAANRPYIIQTPPNGMLQFERDSTGRVSGVTVEASGRHGGITFRPGTVVLAAGAGNAMLRDGLGLSEGMTQLRPLHMVLARGDLPPLNGHCVDGAKTRVTITSDVDREGHTIWQIGGQVAEDGVHMEPRELIQHVRRELQAVLPGWKFPQVSWSTYRVDRAESRTVDGSRPDDVQIVVEGNVLTTWPTKLVLAPRLADCVRDRLESFGDTGWTAFEALMQSFDWPRPGIALPPWERELKWISAD